METTLKRLHSGAADGLAVHVAEHQGRTLIECRDAEAFLSRIGALPPGATLPAGACLRGVFAADGAVFELLDPFGRASDEAYRLDAEEAAQLLREIW